MKFQFEYDGKCMTCGDCPCNFLEDEDSEMSCGITFRTVSPIAVACQGFCPLTKVEE